MPNTDQLSLLVTKITKWFFLPLLFAVLAMTFTERSSQKHKCEAECEFLGYSKSKYYMPLRGREGQCFCLDPNDFADEKRIHIYLHKIQ